MSVATADLPVGRRELNKRMTRRDLLDAGRRLFSEKGIYDARVEDLTRYAGVAKGTIYGYFPDKLALIHAVVTEGFDELIEAVRVRSAGATGEARARSVFRGHVDFLAEHPDLLRVFHQVRGMLKFNRREWRPLRGIVERYLDRLAVELAGPRGTPDTELAQAVWGAISGTLSAHAALADGSLVGLDRERVVEAMVPFARAYARGAAGARTRSGATG